jgi:hypothetical protein
VFLVDHYLEDIEEHIPVHRDILIAAESLALSGHTH